MNTEEKLNRYLHYLAQDPENIPLLMTISAFYCDMQDWDAAHFFIQKAETLSPLPLSFEALLMKANILHYQQNITAAITTYTELLTHPHSTAEVPGKLALLYFDINQTQQAQFFGEEALRRDPCNYEARLVQVLLKMLENKANTKEIDALLTQNPEEVRLLFARGTIHLSHIQPEMAQKSFLQVVDLWPDFYENWLSLFWCYVLNNAHTEAEAVCQRMISIDPEAATGYAAYGLLEILRNHPTESASWCAAAASREPENELLLFTEILNTHTDKPEKRTRALKKLLPESEKTLQKILMQAVFEGMESSSNILH